MIAGFNKLMTEKEITNKWVEARLMLSFEQYLNPLYMGLSVAFRTEQPCPQSATLPSHRIFF